MIGYRAMTPADLSATLDWAADEGWNPGLDDAGAFLAADPRGFFVCVDGDTPVAAISVVNHSDEFAFLGLYICKPEYRGQGLGLALWRHAIAHAGDRTVGLDGVLAQQANYAKSGFVSAGQTTRFVGRVDGASSPGIRAATTGDIPRLVEMEAQASGSRKVRYMSAWFAQSMHRRTFVQGDDGRIDAVATVRRCRDGAKVGPLIAPDASSARDLLCHVATVFGDDLIIDVPDISAGLKALCQDLGFAPGFETARMYRGSAPAVASRIYAVGSLELG